MKRKVVLGLVLALVAISLPAPVAVGQGQEKTEVCHITATYVIGGDSVPIGSVINIADPAYPAHIAHGDPKFWELIVLPDGGSACTEVKCPCWDELSLNAYYLEIEAAYEGWETYSSDHNWPCPPGFTCVYVTTWVPPHAYIGLMAYVGGEFLCQWTEYIPEYNDIWVSGLSAPAAAHCREDLIGSRIYQEADEVWP